MHPLRLILSGILLVWVTFSLTTCRDSERDEDLETLSARECALAYHIFDDVVREVHRLAIQHPFINQYGITPSIRTCIESATVSDTSFGFPVTMVINYGSSTTACEDDILRQGVIRATFEKKYLKGSSNTSIIFNNYIKDGYQVDGAVNLKTLGLNSDGDWTFSWEVTDGKITSVNTNIQWDGVHRRIWTAGESSSDPGNANDDIFSITGVASGRNSRGNTFNNEITSAYVSDFACPWFISGGSALTIPNLTDRTLNYNTGEDCNNTLYQRRNDTYIEVVIP